nr:transforming acidic coiled coil containing [Hymenolepis microstoma]
MGDAPKRTQMSLKEIDRLLADSPMPTPRRVGGVAGATPLPVPRVTITDEDLALLDESEMEERPLSPVAAVSNAAVNEETTERTTHAEIISDKQNERTPSREVLESNIDADRISSLSGADYSPPLYSSNNSIEQQPSNRRSSLSRLAHGWSTMMGHPIAGSVAEELAAQQLPTPVFSPLLSQSSKLITDMVSSLLSPWSTASRRIREQEGLGSNSFVQEASSAIEDGGNELALGDRSCEQSLINAFGKIAVADDSSPEREAFFSPTHERQSTDNRRESFLKRSANVTLKSALMEDTREATFMSETSHYSDATSALPSPLRTFKPLDQQQAPYPSPDKSGEFREELTRSLARDIDSTPIGYVSRRTLSKGSQEELTALDNQQHHSSQVSPLMPPKPIEENEQVLCCTKKMDFINVQNNSVKETSFVSPYKTSEKETSQFLPTPISGQQSQVVLMTSDQQSEHPDVGIFSEFMAKNRVLDTSKPEPITPKVQQVDTTGCVSQYMPETEFSDTHITSEGQAVCEEPEQYSSKELPDIVSEDAQVNFVELPEEHNVVASEEPQRLLPGGDNVLESFQNNSESCLVPPLQAEEVIQRDLFSPPVLPALRVLPHHSGWISEQKLEQSSHQASETEVAEIPVTGHRQAEVSRRLSSQVVLNGADTLPLENIEPLQVSRLSENAVARDVQIEVSEHFEPNSQKTALSQYEVSFVPNAILQDHQIGSGEQPTELLDSVVPDVSQRINLEFSDHNQLYSVDELPEADVQSISDVSPRDQQMDQIEFCAPPELPQIISAQLEESSARVQKPELQLEVSEHPEFCVSHTSPRPEIVSIPGVVSGAIQVENYERSGLSNVRDSTVSENIQAVFEPQVSCTSRDSSKVDQISREHKEGPCLSQDLSDAEVPPVCATSSGHIHLEVSEQLKFTKFPASIIDEDAHIPLDILGVRISAEDAQMEVSYQSNDFPKSRAPTVPAEISEQSCNELTVDAPTHPNTAGEYIQIDTLKHSPTLSEPRVPIVLYSNAEDLPCVDAFITKPLVEICEEPKGESLAEVVTVAPSSSKDVPMEIELTEEAVVQNNSAMKLYRGASEHSPIVEDIEFEPISECIQGKEFHKSPMGSTVEQTDDKPDVNTTSVLKIPQSVAKSVRISASPCFSVLSMVDGNSEDLNRSRRSLKRASSEGSNSRRNSTDNNAIIRKSLALAEETECLVKETTSPRNVETSLNRTSGRRRTITLDKPSPHLQASLSNSGQLEGTPPIIRRRSSKTALDGPTKFDDKDRAGSLIQECRLVGEGVNQSSGDVKSIELGQENKENVAPEAQSIVANHGTTQCLLMPSASPQAPCKPSKVSTASQQQHAETGESVDEEKARLLEEVQALRRKKDVLGFVLAKYRSTFEEALDNQSRMHFATASAGAQADQEAHDARRQAATLHTAALESQKRQERIMEDIERRRTNQELIIKRTEILKEKYLRLLEKGQTYKKYCLDKIQKAVERLETTKTELDKELSRLRVQLKQLELKQRSLETNLEQKGKENEELTKICDNLLKGVL